MDPVILVLSLTLSLAGDTPADLAGRLGSADPAVVEDAEGRLEEGGRDALPALRLARGAASDPTVARRIDDLITLIERRRLLRPTVVALDPGEATVAEALAGIGRRSGFRLALDPNVGERAGRRFGPIEGGPVPFWEAVDRVAGPAGLRVDPDPPEVSEAGPATVRLVDAGGATPIRSALAGPYRVDLVGSERHRRVVQARPGREPIRLDELTVEVRVVAEPGVVIERNGPTRITEAVDASGADLRGPGRPVQVSTRPRWRPGLGQVDDRIALTPPPGLGGSIRRLSGVVPVVAMARTGPVMTIPLDGSEGRPYRADGLSLMVRRMSRAPGDGRINGVQVVIVGEETRPNVAIAPGPRRMTLAPVRPAYDPGDHVEVLDDLGRPLPISWGFGPPREGGPAEFTVSISPGRGLGPATSLRYHGLVAEATEIPFRFEGVPLP